MAARLDRAAGERMFFMGRVALPARGDDSGDDGGASGVLAPFVVTGLSGSVYTIHLSTEEAGPSAADAGGVGIVAKCNCPDHIFRRAACKHILFILLRVLNIPKDRLLVALTPSGQPLTHTEVTAAAAASHSAAINPFYAPPKALADRLRAIAGDFSGGDGASSASAAASPPPVAPRVPAADDDCPICYEAFGVVASASDPAVVYCRRGCGGGVHADCFRRWEANAAGVVTCVYCRAPWKAPPLSTGVMASGDVLDSSRGGRRRLIDLSNYLPAGPATRERGNVKKKGGATGGATGSGSGGGKGKGKGKTAARSAQGPSAAAEPDSDADADTTMVASRLTSRRASSTHGANIAPASSATSTAPRRVTSNRSGGKAAAATAAATAAAAVTGVGVPTPRVTRSGMLTRSRQAALSNVELPSGVDETDGRSGGDDAVRLSDVSAGDGVSCDGGDAIVAPPPKRSRRSRR
ncbi:hypothetical protein MMPV_007895 [Pyropia vietnamensis]